MPKKNSSKVFREAFDQMFEGYLKPEGITAKHIANKTGVGNTTISDFRLMNTNLSVYNLEKILLDKIITDEALEFFIREVTTLLNKYRNHPSDYDEDEETIDENADLEDVVLGGSQGSKNLRKSGRTVTPEKFQQNKEIMERIGHEGEKCVNAYLQKLKNEGKIGSFEWISKQNAISPYDFLISLDGDTKIFLDVKSTAGEFERQIHISRSELELMSSDRERYDIYRIFDIDKNTRTAKLKIAEDVRSFAQGIIEVFNGLPQGVCADGISVDPSKSGLNFQHEIEIQLPDEPDEELEESEDI